MNCILALLFCFSPLFAATIGPVEYHLPNDNWVIAKEFESPRGKTLIYIQSGQKRLEAGAFFGATIDFTSGNFDNLDSAISKLSQLLPPGVQMGYTILDRGDETLLLELTIHDDKSEQMHGWARLFSTEEESVTLMYLTENVNDLSADRSLWLPVLQEAFLY